jgi:molybdate transport system regulatory protein
MTTLRVHILVDFGPDRALGRGRVALLEGMQRTGSLSQTAREMGMSYRRAWLALQSLTALFDRPIAVATKGGRGDGGVELTPLGVNVIAANRRLEDTLGRQAALEFGEPVRAGRRASTKAQGRADPAATVAPAEELLKSRP